MPVQRLNNMLDQLCYFSLCMFHHTRLIPPCHLQLCSVVGGRDYKFIRKPSCFQIAKRPTHPRLSHLQCDSEPGEDGAPVCFWFPLGSGFFGAWSWVVFFLEETVTHTDCALFYGKHSICFFHCPCLSNTSRAADRVRSGSLVWGGGFGFSLVRF